MYSLQSYLRPPGGSIIEITPLLNKAVSLLYIIDSLVPESVLTGFTINRNYSHNLRK